MIKLIYACDEAGGIGKNNSLPWKLESDLRNFKKLTTDNIVVMGRKTFESIGNKPLKNRLNIVLSRDVQYCADKLESITLHQEDPSTQVLFVNTDDIKSFICSLQINHPGKHVFIIGGSEIYNQTIGFVDEVIQTKIYKIFDCDTFFKFDEVLFELSITHHHYYRDELSHLEYDITTYTRKYKTVNY